jgi:predicted acylesterase/phospholipase RssA
MEELLANRDPDYRLASTFDYIAGTSTGAIIAAALSLGHRVDEVEALYRRLGPRIFKKKWLPGWFRSLYKSGPITQELQKFFGVNTTLGDPRLRSLLMAVTHRTDTDSLWPLTNVSTARYNDATRADCNLALPLWQIVRGSTAAPVFFPPEEIPLGEKKALFQDGGVTPFNNPALLLVEMATSPRYTLGWSTGADRLLVVSVGTGSAPAVSRQLQRKNINLLFEAKTLIRVFMNGSSTENDRLCQVLGETRYAPFIDREFNAAAVAQLQSERPLFSYVRYNAPIGAVDLKAVPDLASLDPNRMAKLDAARLADIDGLIRVGRHARDQVRLTHFAGFLP